MTTFSDLVTPEQLTFEQHDHRQYISHATDLAEFFVGHCQRDERTDELKLAAMPWRAGDITRLLGSFGVVAGSELFDPSAFPCRDRSEFHAIRQAVIAESDARLQQVAS